jgi:TolB-like protein/tetratricopeptide (TPR) repeat protein
MNETLRTPGRSLRFGSFEVDLQARELRKRGIRLRLQEKPFQILELLLENAGSVVAREELRRKLWPDTFVGFNRSLNTAINTLRYTLGDSADNPRFIETCQRRGYRIIAPVERIDGAHSREDSTVGVIDSVAVLPFRNDAADPETEYLSDGLTESIINTLSQLPGVRVMARSTVFRYKGREVDPQKVGRELMVGALLMGRVLQRGDALSVGIELVDVNNGWRLWGEQYKRRLSDIFMIQEEISRDISHKLRLHLAGEVNMRFARYYTKNPEAYHDYLKGRHHFNRMAEEGLKKAIAHFQQAIRKDSNFALAYAGLADCYSISGLYSLLPPREMMPKAKEAALNALRIDDTLAEAHASLAGILKGYEWDWAAAEKEYRRALELNPNYATAHHLYADFLSAMGRPEEGIREIYRAQDLDPLSLVISMEVGWNFYIAREYDRAIEHSLRTLELEPHFCPAHHTLGLAYVQLGRYEESINEIRRALDGSRGNPAPLAALGHAHAMAGNPRGAKEVLDTMGELSRYSYVSAYLSALVYAGLGEGQLAIESIARAIEERDSWLVWLKTEPRFDGLRSSPRFTELLRRIGFEL